MSSSKIWKLLCRDKVYDGSPFIKIFKDKVELPSGDIIDDYHRIEVNNAVMLLIENDNNQLLVYEEYRHGIGEVSYTFPAGGIENDETKDTAAAREAREELGISFNNCKLLKSYIVSGSYMFSELSMMSIKNIIEISEPNEKDIENPDVLWLSKKDVKDAISNHEFKGLTYATAALLWLFNKDEKK